MCAKACHRGDQRSPVGMVLEVYAEFRKLMFFFSVIHDAHRAKYS